MVPIPLTVSSSGGISLGSGSSKNWFSRQAMIRIGSTEYWVDNQTSRDIVKRHQEWNWNRSAAPWFQYVSERSLGGEHQHNLLEAISLTLGCQSADPRDKVFGILGFAHTGEAGPELHPNYCISTQHVFIGIFAYCLINLRDTRVLHWASESQGRGQRRSWMPVWKSLAMLPELVHHCSLSFIRWALDWKRDFVVQISSQIKGRDFEREQRNKAQLLSSLSIAGLGEALLGFRLFYQKYWTREDFEVLTHASYRLLSPQVVQVVPIGMASTNSSQQKATPLPRGREQESNTTETIANILNPGKTPWYAHASVSPKDGSLSIPLIHLFCIKDKSVQVSQTDGLRCYRISSVASCLKLDGYLSNIAAHEKSKSATAKAKQPEVLDDNRPYLFFITRTEDVDLVAPDISHIFYLGQRNLAPLVFDPYRD